MLHKEKLKPIIATLEEDEDNERLKTGLFDLISNVILFEEPGTEGKQFHFRIGADKTISFRYLDNEQKRNYTISMRIIFSRDRMIFG